MLISEDIDDFTDIKFENAPLIKFIRNYIWDSHFPYAH